MSLILDALSRAERDRRAADGVPDLLSPAETPRQRRQRRFWLAVAVAVAFAAIALGAGYLLLFRDPPSPAPVPAATPDAPDRTPAEVPIPAGRSPDTRSAAPPAAGAPPPAATPDNAAIAALYAGGSDATVPASESRPGRANDAAASGADTAGGAQSEGPVIRETAPAEPPPVAASETPLDLEEILREARRAQADTGLSEHPVPLLNDLSQQYRDRVPTLMYLRHDYAGDGRGSSVVINGATLREGQRSGPVQLVEILADSVILRFEGRDFRLRALNSWVNL